jgi:hypothetical protein
MANFQQTLPPSLRFGSPATPEKRGPATDRRPYLVTAPPRKTVASTQQFLALFPHESEDARLTGATRSLYRRLLALNLPRPAVRVETAERREVSEPRFTLVDARSPESDRLNLIA